jgi:hypothetical protein
MNVEEVARVPEFKRSRSEGASTQHGGLSDGDVERSLDMNINATAST